MASRSMRSRSCLYKLNTGGRVSPSLSINRSFIASITEQCFTAPFPLSKIPPATSFHILLTIFSPKRASKPWYYCIDTLTFNQVVRGSNPRTLTVKKTAEILMFQGFPLFLVSFSYCSKWQQMIPNKLFLSHQFLTISPISHQFQVEILIDIFCFLGQIQVRICG